MPLGHLFVINSPVLPRDGGDATRRPPSDVLVGDEELLSVRVACQALADPTSVWDGPSTATDQQP